VGELVPTVDARMQRRLSAYVSQAFGHLEAHELAHLPIQMAPPAEGVQLGLCSGEHARRLLYDTVAEVIVPGLEAVGLQAQLAWDTRPPLATANAA
jgi:hypothetical protein